MTADRRTFLEAAAMAGGAVLPNASTAAGGSGDLRKASAHQSRSDDMARNEPATRPGGLSPARRARMHAVMAGYVERGEVPGIVTLVSRHGDVHVDALGQQAIDGEPMRRDTIFRIASLTKPITAAATMILVEECKLRLDEPVDRRLPELANRKVLKRLDGPIDDTVPAKRPITVRDLLTFRMGFGLVLAPPNAYPIQKAISEQGLAIPSWPATMPHGPDEWIRRLGTLPLIHQPGEGWMYHAGSDVLGVLIARASGQPFEAFLRERILAPLGMKDTAFSVSPEKRTRLASCYEFDHAHDKLELFDGPDGQWSRPPAFPSGGGGLVSTADDFAAFAQMLLNKGKVGRERILARPTVEAMTTDHLTPEQRVAAAPIIGASSGWGFGLSVVTQPDVVAAPPGRYGWNGGLGTSWWSDPKEDLVAIIMTQRMFESAVPPNVCLDFWTSAYQAIDD
jgi:CubicO group peptidase (beta-lactamase class C family)